MQQKMKTHFWVLDSNAFCLFLIPYRLVRRPETMAKGLRPFPIFERRHACPCPHVSVSTREAEALHHAAHHARAANPRR